MEKNFMEKDLKITVKSPIFYIKNNLIYLNGFYNKDVIKYFNREKKINFKRNIFWKYFD